jgi:hypothetical protein
MPISITIEGNNADEVRQLVHDLAETIASMKAEDIPVDTKVSTLEQPAQPSPNSGGNPVPPMATTATSGTVTVPAAPVAPVAPVAAAPTTPAAPAAPQAPQSPAAPAAPTSVPEYDFNQLATATMQLQQAGHNIFELFQQFSIQALNQLPKERYAEYAAALRQRGAKI